MSAQLFKHSGEALFANVGDDVVALNVEGGQCYGMDSIAGTVWGMLAEPAHVESICARLLEIYDVAPEICRNDVAKLIQQFEEEGLLEKVESAG
jgi:hypothetical protein